MTDVVVVRGPRLVADADLVAAQVAAACADLGVSGRVVAAGSAAEVRAALDGGASVVLPGPTAEVRALIGGHPDVVWLDLDGTEPVPGAEHYQGRGMWGTVWAVRRAVYRRRRPATRIAYGPDPEQWGELRRPDGVGRPPVAVLLHGGFWRSIWNADLMDALAIDLAGRGYAAWNLEYRRPDRHGWAATTADVAAGIAAVSEAVPGHGPVVLFGHSAGGQLALRAAADGPGALAVSLAGVLDLVEGDRRAVGEGAVAAALGGSATEIPDVYAASSPLARVPIAVPPLLVQGDRDGLDLIDFNRRYAAAAPEATYLELPGDHFDVIDPRSDIWRATMDAVDARLTSG